jgi:hypothetical protein
MLTTAAGVAVSMLVERVGPFLGAMISTLPISAGPARVFVAMDHDAAFLEASARMGLPAYAGTTVFAAVHVPLARRFRTFLSISGAISASLIATILITRETWSLGGALALHATVFGAAIWATRSARRAVPATRAVSRIWDVPFRAAIVMSLVAAVIIAGRLFGPAAAEATAAAPMVFASVGLVLQPRLGGAVPAAMTANGLLGLIGLAALAFLSISATALGPPAALLFALLICVIWNLALIGMRRCGL